MNRFYTILSALAVILTPAAMMAAAGWEAYAATLAQTGIPWLAVVTGVATAAALECVGILAGETMLLFHGRNDPRWRIAAVVLLAYVVAGLYVLLGTPLVFLPVLAGAVYVLAGLRAQAERESDDSTATAQSDREWQQEQWRIHEANNTAVRLARLQAASKQPASTPLVEPVAAVTPLVGTNGHGPAASSGLYQCRHCDSAFPTMQALGGHVKAAHKER